MALGKAERVKLLMQALRDAETPNSIQEAIELFHTLVNAIEDEHSGVTYDPAMPPDTERMYGPLTDNIKNVAGGQRIRTRSNYIYIWEDGGFVVLSTSGRVITSNMRHELGEGKE